MRNAGLGEAQAEIKIAGRNINNLRYADDTYHYYGRKQRRTKEPLDESERGEFKTWFKTQQLEHYDHGSGPIISWQIDGETMKTVKSFILRGLQNHCRW